MKLMADVLSGSNVNGCNLYFNKKLAIAASSEISKQLKVELEFPVICGQPALFMLLKLLKAIIFHLGMQDLYYTGISYGWFC